MPKERHSLLGRRNLAPLSKGEIDRALSTFLGLDNDRNVNVIVGDERTVFRPAHDESGEYGEIVIGPDIYPGSSVVDANSALSMKAAAAHELSHYHRWNDKMALDETSLWHVDEALTSLQAILRYERHLSEAEIGQLVRDAIQRLQYYVRELKEGDEFPEEA
jgi:hypothetical protein